MKYRWIAVFLALLLAGCTAAPASQEASGQQPSGTAAGNDVEIGISADPARPEASSGPKDGQFVFTRESFPRLDGSTSTVPLAQAMAAVLLGEEPEAVEELVQFSRTTQSYRNLMDGSADILLAAEPADSVLESKEAGGFAWDMEPFAIDGLIFVVSSDNPVDSLTVEQVQQIYTGEITNWSQVGGDDVPVSAFQRNAEAGSQTMMNKLVMDGLELAEPPAELVKDSMYGLMEAVRNYDGSAGAIGYSVYYYANDMRMAEGLKILQINGVEPSAEAFRSGAYPFCNPYYVVIGHSVPEDAPARILFDWVLSGEGQKLVNAMGYAGVLETEEMG